MGILQGRPVLKVPLHRHQATVGILHFLGRYRPALVLSSKLYHQKTGLLICCPISTSIRGAPTEVAVTNLDSPSVVATNLITTLDWRARKTKKLADAEKGTMTEVLLRLLPLIGADRLLSDLSGDDHS